MAEPILNINNATASLGGESSKYLEHDFINTIYDLVEAKKLSRQAPDKSLIKNLAPINGVYSGYMTNRVEFIDPRDNKVYADEWVRQNFDDEKDRLRAIRSINEKIKNYNDWLEKEKVEKGIEKMLSFYEESYYGEWLLNIYLTYPTLNKTKEIIPHRTIDNKFFYQHATNMDSDNFLIRFNKTIYDWIIDMLPKSFNDKDSRFLSEKHLLYQPKLEFENWFMRNGLAINEYKSMFDKYDKKLTDKDQRN